MSAITPPDPNSGASRTDRFPWVAIVIIAFSLFVFGWMIMTAGQYAILDIRFRQ